MGAREAGVSRRNPPYSALWLQELTPAQLPMSATVTHKPLGVSGVTTACNGFWKSRSFHYCLYELCISIVPRCQVVEATVDKTRMSVIQSVRFPKVSRTAFDHVPPILRLVSITPILSHNKIISLILYRSDLFLLPSLFRLLNLLLRFLLFRVLVAEYFRIVYLGYGLIPVTGGLLRDHSTSDDQSIHRSAMPSMFDEKRNKAHVPNIYLTQGKFQTGRSSKIGSSHSSNHNASPSRGAPRLHRGHQRPLCQPGSGNNCLQSRVEARDYDRETFYFTSCLFSSGVLCCLR